MGEKIKKYVKKHKAVSALIATPIVLLAVWFLMRLVIMGVEERLPVKTLNSHDTMTAVKHQSLDFSRSELNAQQTILQVSTDDLAGVVEDMNTVADAMGGYVESSDIYYSSGSTGKGVVTLKIPVKSLQEAIQHVKNRVNYVKSERTRMVDVMKEYSDRSARLTQLQQLEQEYLRMLERADNVQDALYIRSSLDATRNEIIEVASYQSKLKMQASYALLRVEVFGIPSLRTFSPFGEVKYAGSNILNQLNMYVSFMIHAIAKLPIFLLWLITLAIAGVFMAKAVRFIKKELSRF